MAVWLVRAGAQGEYEQKFIQDNKIFITWDDLNTSLVEFKTRDSLIAKLALLDSDAKPKKLMNHASQIWPFANTMQIGDRVILPSKIQPVIYIGKITSNYKFDSKADNPFYHSRSIKWLAEPVPRSHFSQDLLYSFGAFMTVCRITRHDAEARLNQMEANSWQPETKKQIITSSNLNSNDEAIAEELVDSDLEELGHNQIVKLIEAKFKGHQLTLLVKSILEAQGYTCWQSPEGSDGGVDILASDGHMGFGEQKICVEVKSGDGLVDRPTVDKLIGAMTKFNASQGLFVSWGGFKSNVQKELASSFFKVRLWTQRDLLNQLFLNYDKLSADIKLELPLKQIWTVTSSDEI